MAERDQLREDMARETLLDNVEILAELGWDADKIRAEVEEALKVAVDDGLLRHA